MILYDKESVFLGMDQKTLSFLGFQDFNEFKSYCDDPADMFVNRMGYISKFKNFSWIDYTMHSGTLNKNVVIKSKNEKELEAKVNISEIFLMDTFKGKSVIYCVELNFASNSDIKISNIEATGIKSPVSFENMYIKDTKGDILSDNAAESESKIHVKQIELEDIQEDYKPENKIQNQTDINQNEDTQKKAIIFKNEELEPNIKLKVDFEDALEKEKEKEINEDNLDEVDFAQIAEDTGMNLEDIAIHIDELVKKHKNRDNKDEIFEDNLDEVDFAQIAEDTDMNLEDIAIFVNDFVEESQNILKNINDSGTPNFNILKSNFIKLKGIALQLKIDNIVKTLDLIVRDINKNDFSNRLKLFETQIKNLEGELL